MKKLLTSSLLFISILIQSCTPDELDVAPKQVITPAGVDIESAVEEMKQFNFADFKAILLKEVDNDPTTHLTTLYYADAKGRIAPIIENFEVQDAQVTTNGIYVLTNYKANDTYIAFFVKPNFEWVQLKDVYYPNDFKGEGDNGNLVFHNGAILNTTTLQVDRSLVKEDRYIDYISGNFIILTHHEAGRSLGIKSRNIVDLATHKKYPIHTQPYLTFFNIVSFKGTNLVMHPDVFQLVNNQIIDFKTGNIADLDFTMIIYPETLRLDDSSIVGFKPDYNNNVLNLVQLAVKKDNNQNIIPFIIQSSSVSIKPDNLDKGLLFGSDKYYVVKEAEKVKVYDKSLTFKGDVLKGLTKAVITLVNSSVYYSGLSADGLPVTGVYDIDTNQNIILDTSNRFNNIQPL